MSKVQSGAAATRRPAVAVHAWATARAPQLARANAAAGGDRIWFAQYLRGIAALLVVVDHLVVLYWLSPGFAASIANVPPVDKFTFDLPHLAVFHELAGHNVTVGSCAVAMFLLISGFVIPMSLERYRPGQFLVARVFRLYPVWLVAIGVVATVFAISAATSAASFPHGPRAWLENLSLMREWFWTPAINPVSWTLEVELKFYVICAVLVAVASLTRARTVLITGGVLFLLALSYTDMSEALAAGAPSMQFLAFIVSFNAQFLIFMFMGVCFYNYFRGTWRRATFLGSLALLLSMWFVAMREGPLALSADLMTTSYLVGFVIFAGFFILRRRLRFSRTFNFLADISFPLYALHQVVGYSLLVVLYRLHPLPYLNLVEMLVIVVLLSWAVHKLIEDPLNTYGKRLVRRGLPWWLRIGPRPRGPVEGSVGEGRSA